MLLLYGEKMMIEPEKKISSERLCVARMMDGRRGQREAQGDTRALERFDSRFGLSFYLLFNLHLRTC